MKECVVGNYLSEVRMRNRSMWDHANPIGLAYITHFIDLLPAQTVPINESGFKFAEVEVEAMAYLRFENQYIHCRRAILLILFFALLERCSLGAAISESIQRWQIVF